MTSQLPGSMVFWISWMSTSTMERLLAECPLGVPAGELPSASDPGNMSPGLLWYLTVNAPGGVCCPAELPIWAIGSDSPSGSRGTIRSATGYTLRVILPFSPAGVVTSTTPSWMT